MGGVCTSKKGVIVKEKYEEAQPPNNQEFLRNSFLVNETVVKEVSQNPDPSEVHSQIDKNPIRYTNSVVGPNSNSSNVPIIDVENDFGVLKDRMQKIKKYRKKVNKKQKHDRKANSMLINVKPEKNKYLELPAIGPGLRRNTDKISIYNNEETKSILAHLEPISENIDYNKGEEMPQGHAGVCYNALNNNTNKVIVVKTLDFSELTKEAMAERYDYIDNNIDLIREIQCANIINYIGIIEQESKFDILMEYVPGGSLKFILNNFVRFKEKFVKSYVKQILEGLKSCHEQGIYHGDLKSSNILIDDLGIVKLSDFSFIKMTLNNTSKVAYLRKFMDYEEETKEDDFATQTIPMIGSEAYTPPEVVKDPKSKLNGAYDIWQLGCVIVEMLTGQEAWSKFDGDIKLILKNLKITKSHPELNCPVSKTCEDFLDRCFQINPKKRATAEDLLEHPFLKMSEKEMKESLEASNFISFFSILASQKSLSDKGNFPPTINALDERERENGLLPVGDTGGKHDFSFHPKNLLSDASMTSFPNVEIRVSKMIMNKLRNSGLHNSILSNGSIRLNNLSTEHLVGLNDSFRIEEFTHSNLRSSIDNMQSSLIRLSNHSTLRSNNRLALVLKKVQEQNLFD